MSSLKNICLKIKIIMKNIYVQSITKSFIFIVFIIGFSIEVKAANIKELLNTSSNKQLVGNVASIDLTPDLSMKFALGGYGSRMSKPAEAVHDRIWAKALVLKEVDKKYVIGGLANEWISYILSGDQYNHGAGYEPSISFYGDGLGKVIVDGMLERNLNPFDKIIQT